MRVSVARRSSLMSSTQLLMRVRHTDLIGRILVPDPAKRITMAQIKQHPWLAMYVHHRTRCYTHTRAHTHTRHGRKALRTKPLILRNPYHAEPVEQEPWDLAVPTSALCALFAS